MWGPSILIECLQPGDASVIINYDNDNSYMNDSYFYGFILMVWIIIFICLIPSSRGARYPTRNLLIDSVRCVVQLGWVDGSTKLGWWFN